MLNGSVSVTGSPLDYVVAFFAGVLISFTPCVYPLIPISASYIGARGSGSRLKGFTLSLTYVLGIALTYAALGLVASLTGRIFGTISSHPAAYLIAGLIVIVSGIFMLDVFNVALPNLVKLPQVKKANYLSVLLLGLVSGLIIGPCTTPVLGAILGYIATKKNVVYGSMLLFSFAYGTGFVLILVGTFSSLLLSFPRSGKWLEYVKKLCAVVLIGTGAYFIFIAIRRM